MNKSIETFNLSDINSIQSTPFRVLELINAYEELVLRREQVKLDIRQSIHAGIYSRTIKINKGILITGALIKIPTCLIIAGDVYMLEDMEHSTRYTGYHEFKCEADRKQMFYACDDSFLTMYFKTKATSFEEAEREFTDDYDKLLK